MNAMIVVTGAAGFIGRNVVAALNARGHRYTLDLITWSLAHGARMVYASSAATYGDGSLGYSDADDVTPTLRPLNMYGFSKQMVDVWALRHGFLESVVGLKFFNVYGPYEEHKGDMRSLVSKAYRQVRDTGQITLFRSHRPEYAHGEQMRDFIYVDDAVDVDEVTHLLPVGVLGTVRAEQRDLSGVAHLTVGLGDQRAHVALVLLVRAVHVEELQPDNGFQE